MSTRANHHETCSVHHQVCVDPEKCLLAARVPLIEAESRTFQEAAAEMREQRDRLISLARRLAEVLTKEVVGINPMSWHGEQTSCGLCGGTGNNGLRGDPVRPVDHKLDCPIAAAREAGLLGEGGACVCGEPGTPGVQHRTDGPCFVHPAPQPDTFTRDEVDALLRGLRERIHGMICLEIGNLVIAEHREGNATRIEEIARSRRAITSVARILESVDLWPIDAARKEAK